MIEASALSSAKEHTYTSCANTHRHPWWNFICRAYEAVFVASQSVPAHQFISPLIAWRGHGESEPRSVGVLATAHGMTLLMQRTKTQNHNSTKVSLSAPMPRSSGLPVALSAQRHGDFPRSISGSKLPVCSLRGHASPALQTARWHHIITRNRLTAPRLKQCWSNDWSVGPTPTKWQSVSCPKTNHQEFLLPDIICGSIRSTHSSLSPILVCICLSVSLGKRPF